MNRNAYCEIEVMRDGKLCWESSSVEEALKSDPKDRKRCPECHGTIRLHTAGVGEPFHFEHVPKHPGCSLCGSFRGKRFPNPNSVE